MNALAEQFATIAAVCESNRQAAANLDRLWREFGRSVKRDRLRAGMGLREMAKAVGIGKSQLCYLEDGQRTWNLRLARKAVEFLHPAPISTEMQLP
jgi:DNA-binding XRE family transcriptional regulator